MNRLKKILDQKGFKGLHPSNSVLEELGVKIHTWNKWVEGTKDPELAQLPVIAEFLDCDVCDLIERPVPVSHEK
ncbi:helix-turn-helix domain-containing protein [Algoriphagus resistens]|uniref:helix-turn-helix domain-containing protein n=1 Tax=Algoriphagus resistens TaxID=1750590 RepID=UPI000716BAE7|nr:helix-turn-helix transcriptional regulator [Algoriphagus resistens]